MFRWMALVLLVAGGMQAQAGKGTAPELVVRGQTAADSIDLAPTGEWYAALHSGTLSIIRTADLFQLRSIPLAPSGFDVRSFCITYDSQRILIGTKGKAGAPELTRLEVKTANRLPAVPGHVDPWLVACHPKQPLVAWQSGNDIVVAREEDGALKFSVKLADTPGRATDVPATLRFTPDGEGLLYVSATGAHLWRWQQNRELWKLSAQDVHSKNLDRLMDAMDPMTGKTSKKSADKLNQWEFRAGSISPDGARVALRHQDEFLVVSATDGQVQDQVPMPNAVSLSGAVWVDSTHLILDSFRGGVTRDVVAKTSTPIKMFELQDGRSIPGTDTMLMLHSNLVGLWKPKTSVWTQWQRVSLAVPLAIAFSQDGSSLITSHPQSAPSNWDFAHGINNLDAVVKNDSFYFATSADGLWLSYVGSEGGEAIRLHIWNRKDQRDQTSMQIGGGLNNAEMMAFSPDGKWLAAVAGEPRRVQLWSLPDFAPVAVPAMRFSNAGSDGRVSFSPDGKKLALTVGNSVRVIALDATHRTALADKVISIPTETIPLLLHLDGGVERMSSMQSAVTDLWELGFSPDGKRLVVSGGQFGHVYNTATWAEEEPIPAMSFGANVNFSQDGRFLITTTEVAAGRAHLDDKPERAVTVWDLEKHVESARYKQMQTSSEVRMSPDGRFLALGLNGGVGLYHFPEMTPAVMLYRFGDRDWLAVTPDGSFDGTPGGWQQLGWRFNGDTFNMQPLELFFRAFYSPGLLQQVMSGAPRKTIAVKQLDNRLMPAVEVVSVKNATTPGRVDVTVRAHQTRDATTHAGSGLEDLRLFRDGQLVGSGYVDLVEAEGKARRVQGGFVAGRVPDGEYVFHDVKVKHGADRFDYDLRNGVKIVWEAYAFNSARVKSPTSTLEWTQPIQDAGSKRDPKKAFVLSIGVDHYAAGGCELRYSTSDAEKMAQMLTDRLKSHGYAVETVKLQSPSAGDSSGATREKIHAELARIAAAATPDDAMFLSFSGHGYSAAAGAFYILPSDTQGDCRHPDDALTRTAISADDLADWLRPVDAGEIALILDACYSAESVQAGDFRPGPLGSKGLGQLAYDKRMRVLAASQADAVAHEYDYLHQGLLTYVLTQDGLAENKADWKPKDGKISVGEWLAYAAAAVPVFRKKDEGASRGLTPEAPAAGSNLRVQVPALFDFATGDSVALK